MAASALSPASLLARQHETEVALFTGQSKALGWYKVPCDGPQLTRPLPNLFAWNVDNSWHQNPGSAWIPAVLGCRPCQTTPDNDGALQGNPGFYAMYRRAQANPGKRFFLFLIAQGSTRAEEWAPGGKQWARIDAELANGFDALPGIPRRVDYVAVNQGESNHFDPDGKLWTRSWTGFQDHASRWWAHGAPFLFIPPVFGGRLSNRYHDVRRHADGTNGRHFVDTRYVPVAADNIHFPGSSAWMMAHRIMMKLEEIGIS